MTSIDAPSRPPHLRLAASGHTSPRMSTQPASGDDGNGIGAGSPKPPSLAAAAPPLSPLSSYMPEAYRDDARSASATPAGAPHGGPALIARELARVQCSGPPATLAFAATHGGSSRLVALTSAATVWSSRLHSSRNLPLADHHRATHLAVATRALSSLGRAAPSLIAVASEHTLDSHAMRSIRVVELGGRRGDSPRLLRELILPAAIHAMAFCGERYLCVAHRNEYVLLSLATGSVRELFSFCPDFGTPILRRLSPNELLVVQPPPRAGERQLGMFLDKHGDVARRSTAYWRRPPLGCLVQGRALVTLLPNAIEFDHPDHEPRRQLIAFPDARCADGAGDWMLFANSDSVYTLIPPSEEQRQRQRQWQGGCELFPEAQGGEGDDTEEQR
jgi:hypothetical protein